MSTDRNRSATSSRFQIGDILVDQGTRQVIRDGQIVTMGALTLDFLLALAEAAPAMLSYDALADKVWKGRRVAPETLAQRAKMLRDALGDDARNPRYVTSVRGKGYRLVAEVMPTDEQSTPTRNRRWPYLALAASLVLATGLALHTFVNRLTDTPSVAVLPFADMSAAGDQRYLADGIAEELINQLARLNGLHVASRTESFFFFEPNRSVREIGNALSVSSVLEGSVRRDGDRIRVTVQLIDVRSGGHLWNDDYDRRMEDILLVQDDIAMRVAGALGVTLGVGEVNEFPGAGTDNIEAYEAFLREDFVKALSLDPEYAAAWGARGLEIAATMWRNDPRDAPEIIRRALAHAAKAIDLDPGSAEAHTNYATIVYTTWDWQAAEAAFARARSLWHNQFVMVHLANMYMRTGRSREALSLFRERETILGVPGSWPEHRIFAELGSGDFAGARRTARWMSEDFHATVNLWIALNEGSIDSVVAAIDALPPNAVDTKFVWAPLRDKLTEPGKALALLKSIAADSSGYWDRKYHSIAKAAAFLGDPEFALETLMREISYTPIRFGALWEPVMADVRRLPAFHQFVTDVNLVDYWRAYGWADDCRPLGDEDFVCD